MRRKKEISPDAKETVTPIGSGTSKKLIGSRVRERYHQSQRAAPNQLELQLDFYSDRIKSIPSSENEAGLLSTANREGLIIQDLVREPMRLLQALTQLSVLERRMYWMVLSQIRNIQYRQKPQDYDAPNSMTFYFHVSDIVSEGTKESKWSSNYIKEVIAQLGSRVIKWETNKNIFTQLTVFPTAQYRIGEGTIMLQLHHLLIPGFLELGNNFSQFKLETAMSLSTEYSQILYSWFSRHVWRGKWIIPVEELKIITAASAKSYEEFSNLKNRILEPALKQINELTDLSVSYTPLYLGRKVTRLDFTIAYKEENQTEQEEQKRQAKDRLNEALELMKSFSLEQKLEFAHNTLRDYYTFLTDTEKHQILNDQTYLLRFCTAECYISSGLVDKNKHQNYIRKSVFNPGN